MTGKNKIVFSLWLLLILGLVSCQEIYDPQVSAGENILVVDGLLTDAGVCRVTLSLAVPYDDPQGAPVPVEGASVTVWENDSAMYVLRETGTPGTYIDSYLPTHAGHDYLLEISYKGEEYRSSPQPMLPRHDPDTIFGEVTTQRFPFKGASGDILYNYYKGGDIHLGFRDLPENAKSFRFVPTFYVQYVAMEVDQLIPPSYYIWYKEGFPYQVNITGSDFPTASGEMIHDLCFFPFDQGYYGFVQEWPYPPYAGGMDAFVVMFDLYRLNESAAEYYKAMKDLLEAQGKMFDPIASQLPGNMQCTTDPREKVVGFFEVSAYSAFAFQVLRHGDENPLSFEETPSLKGVPRYGYTKDMYPPFWVIRGGK